MTSARRQPPEVESGPLQLDASNLEAERAVLGSILIDPLYSLPIALDCLKPEHFWLPRHGVLFQALRCLAERTHEFDVIVVANYLEEMGLLEKAGGRLFLNDLIAGCATSASLEHWCRIVFEKAVRRGLVMAGHRIVELGNREETSVESIYDQALALLMQANEMGVQSQVNHVSAMGEDFVQWMGRLRFGDTHGGVGTGYSDLDKLTGDLQGSVTVVAGATSMGKTAFLLNMAWRLVNQGEAAGYLTLEMTPNQLMKRLVQIVGHIPVSQLRYTKDEVIRACVKTIYSKLLFLCKFSEATLWSLLRQMRELVSRYKVRVIFIDHLQQITIPDYPDKRHRELGAIMSALRQFALRYNVAVVIGCQVSREASAQKERPKLWWLRDSGEIENSLDVAIGLYRATYYDRALPQDHDVLEAIVMKQRNGETGTANLMFFMREQRIEPSVAGWTD